jgi:hypothetical protein
MQLLSSVLFLLALTPVLPLPFENKLIYYPSTDVHSVPSDYNMPYDLIKLTSDDDTLIEGFYIHGRDKVKPKATF